MTTLVYHYVIEGQFNNLFQLLNKTKSVEFLAIKIVAYLQINRVDLALTTLAKMKAVEEDSCLVTLCHCWVTLFNPQAPLNAYDVLMQSLNELQEKFGYSLKTYNILGTVLMIKGENEKAAQIFEAALQENNIYELQDGDS